MADADDDAIEPSKFIRYGHTANYNKLDKKIYFWGGIDRHNSTSADFFTLEISNSLNITAPKFEQKTLDPTLPNAAFATSVINNSTIYVYGRFDGTMLFQGFFIDISSKTSWNKLDGLPKLGIPQASIINAILDSSGSIYVFGRFINLSTQQQISRRQMPFSDLFPQLPPLTLPIQNPFTQPDSSSQQTSQSQPNLQPQSRPSIQSQPSIESQPSLQPSSTQSQSSIQSQPSLQQSSTQSQTSIQSQTSTHPEQQSISAMLIYNINMKNWITIDTNNHDQSKLPASGFTATYLKRSNSIIYIGGNSSDENFISMNQIWTYSISDRTLTSKNTDENNIVGRYGHSACLVQNKIIVYGGLSTLPLDSSNALVILEINDGNYNWKTPNITPNTEPIPYYHTATIIDDTYMIVAFGKEANGMLIGDTNQINNSGDVISNIDQIEVKNYVNGDVTSNTKVISILKVDVQNSNYMWVTDFNQTNQTPKKGKNIGGIVGGVIGGILVVALLAGFVFFFYRKINKRKHRNSESFRGLTTSTRQNSTQQLSIPTALNSRSLPSIPLNSNTSTQLSQAEQSAPVTLTSPRQNSTQKSSIPPASNARLLPSVPWVSSQNSNTSTQLPQAELSVPVMLTPPLTSLNMSELSSVESRRPLDSSSSGPSLLNIPLVSSNPLSPFYRHDE
ncbi:717_t:CDS:2 [Ambispora gerdemannii]|uniref:717_t:CDS:1 n=1 Tax=Ambispora gerdemannii TaxID=144530 RepID=A0A9N9AH33_9GLOM|nr:717_t:CDS:2 [Ambispora gerdemannii]